MKVDKGNVFEMRRLQLPEHRSEMRRFEHERSRRTKPVIAEHEFEEMTYTINNAIESESTVSMTLFGPFEDEVWVGVPVICAGALHLVVDGERRRVPVERLIAVK